MAVNESLGNNTSFISSTDPTVPLHHAVIYASIIGLTSLASLCLNTVHFMTIQTVENMTMPSRTIFRVHAICDMMLAVTYGFMFPLILWDSWYLRNIYCYVNGGSFTIFSFYCITLTGLRHMDQLLSIVLPYRYTAAITKVKLCIIIATSFVVNLLFFLGNISAVEFVKTSTGICWMTQNVNQNPALLVVGIEGPYVFLVSLYVWLLIVTYRHAKKIHAQELIGAPQLQNGNTIFSKLRLIKRALRMAVVTIGWFAITWGPLQISLVVTTMDISIHYGVIMFIFWIFLCQTFGNPLILAFKQSYRNAMMKKVRPLIVVMQCKRPN